MSHAEPPFEGVMEGLCRIPTRGLEVGITMYLVCSMAHMKPKSLWALSIFDFYGIWCLTVEAGAKMMLNLCDRLCFARLACLLFHNQAPQHRAPASTNTPAPNEQAMPDLQKPHMNPESLGPKPRNIPQVILGLLISFAEYFCFQLRNLVWIILGLLYHLSIFLLWIEEYTLNHIRAPDIIWGIFRLWIKEYVFLNHSRASYIISGISLLLN